MDQFFLETQNFTLKEEHCSGKCVTFLCKLKTFPLGVFWNTKIKTPRDPLSTPSDTLTMQGSVNTEIKMGTRQSMLFKVLEANNKKMWKHWFVYLCIYLCVESEKEMMQWSRRGGKGQLIDWCKMRIRQNSQEHSKMITHVQRSKSEKPIYILL